jgi:hypothetical protein
MPSLAGVEFFEKSVSLPGMDGGEGIDTTTMRNIKYRTTWPRQLKTLTAVDVEVAWTSDMLDEANLFAMVNTNQEIEWELPDQATYTIWAYVQNVRINPMVEGEQPTMTMTIQPTMTDNDKVEQDPVFVAAP